MNQYVYIFTIAVFLIFCVCRQLYSLGLMYSLCTIVLNYIAGYYSQKESREWGGGGERQIDKGSVGGGGEGEKEERKREREKGAGRDRGRWTITERQTWKHTVTVMNL